MQDKAQYGQYIVSEQLGKGGMATVYKAHHARLDRFVAIKVMHNVFLQDETFLARFEREARIVARLEHPNIVPIYDYSEQDGNPYLVMKHIEGATLKQRAMKQGITLQDANTLMSSVADALDYAHRQGVLHRDMKPSNILIDTTGKPYLTDFGLARMAQVGESTISHDMMLGTPFYLSPEQAQGQKELTSATDTYSFGIVLYELLTGSVPFSGDSAYAIVHGHIYGDVKPPSEVNPSLPRAVDAVLMKALSKSPSERYATAADLMKDFAQATSADALRIVQSTVPSSETRDRDAKPVQNMASSLVAETPAKKNPSFRIDAKNGRVEGSIDLGNIKWDEVGQRFKQGVTELASHFEEDEENSGRKSKKIKDADLTDEERIRRRVKKQQEERSGLITHFMAYATINTIIWVVSIANSDGFPWGLMFMTGGWGIGMAAHAWEYYTKYGAGAKARNAEIERALENELGSRRDKRKNVLDDDMPTTVESTSTMEAARSVRLTDEGEFTDSYVQEIDQRRKRRR